jgi:hypothetical protein
MAKDFSVTSFKSNLTFGGARATLFSVQLVAPPGVPGLDLIKAPMLIRAASIPASVEATIPVSYFGRELKLPGDRTFQPWQTTVINDEDFQIRNALETWSNAINQYRGNKRIVRGLGFKANATVTQYAKTGETLRTYKFEGLYPSVIGDIGLNWDSTNAVEEFQVTFEYDNWVLDSAGTTTGSIGDQG